MEGCVTATSSSMARASVTRRETAPIEASSFAIQSASVAGGGTTTVAAGVGTASRATEARVRS